ncbi:MAG: NRDE family protein [Myxococcota bacterium]
MCTLIVMTRMFEGVPLLVADNRDERLSRPAEGPSWWPEPKEPRIFAPRDLEAGGTWLGLNDVGLFAGLTNRHTSSYDPGRGSRGHIVSGALKFARAAQAAAAIAAMPPEDTNPFHLVLADREDAHLVWHDGAAVHHKALTPGWYVVTERSLGAAPSAREDFVRAQMPELVTGGAPKLEALAGLLSHQRGAGFDDVRVELPERDYGTRASLVVQYGAQLEDVDFWWRDGGFIANDPSAEFLRPLEA